MTSLKHYIIFHLIIAQIMIQCVCSTYSGVLKEFFHDP